MYNGWNRQVINGNYNETMGTLSVRDNAGVPGYDPLRQVNLMDKRVSGILRDGSITFKSIYHGSDEK